jgi:HK97 family phage major capsid protein
MNRMEEIQKRMKEISELLNADQEINIDKLEKEIEALKEERKELEQKETRRKLADEINKGEVETRKIEKGYVEKMDFEKMSVEEVRRSKEYRSAYLKNLQGVKLNEIEKRALTTINSSSAVPTLTEDKIIDKLRQTSVLFPRISVSYIGSNVKLVVANAKNSAKWKAEGSDGTPENDTVTAINLTGHELIKLAEISAKLNSMSIYAFETYIVDEIGRQMSIAFENAILNGQGSDEDEPEGILNDGNFTSVNEVGLDGDDTVDHDVLMDMLAKLPTLYHQNAVFVMSRKMLFGEVRKIQTADGNPIYVYNPQDRASNSILGYPIVINDYIDDDTILLGDLSYYRMNIPQALEITTSEHAGFKSGKKVYRGLAVADGKVALKEAFVRLKRAT